ncbi:hypothetical protein [Paenibacillus tarimensis]|nr:hypothetical protein [Paenibacillus tarimensis]MCF2946295.1 hypothetical protein [Paenibacillus tarimensis]
MAGSLTGRAGFFDGMKQAEARLHGHWSFQELLLSAKLVGRQEAVCAPLE